jgi:hypothetical protein
MNIFESFESAVSLAMALAFGVIMGYCWADRPSVGEAEDDEDCPLCDERGCDGECEDEEDEEDELVDCDCCCDGCRDCNGE